MFVLDQVRSVPALVFDLWFSFTSFSLGIFPAVIVIVRTVPILFRSVDDDTNQVGFQALKLFAGI